MGKNKSYVILETMISVFTVDRGKLKILLVRKKDDPYKGYWVLPNKIISETETLEDGIQCIIEEQIKTDAMYLEQDYTFSSIDRNPNERVVATSYIGLIDSKSYEIKNENGNDVDKEWFQLAEIPKMAFDHKEIIEKAVEKLKTKLVNTNVLKCLFPSDFSLPELQSVYESVMDIKLDRRNFRKKFINLGLIEDTGYSNIGGSGRPAKLYRFKDDIKEVNLF